jgi:uncharacterized protein (TIGR02145 family)
MAENLKVSHYRNGDEIPRVTDVLNWNHLKSGAWCYYDNNESYNNIYGKRYNWYAVADSRGICPDGYHVPTREDIAELFGYLGTKLGSKYVIGGALKSTGTAYWQSPNAGATNSTGFSALPAGKSDGESFSNDLGFYAAFWGAYSEEGSSFTEFFNLYYNDQKVRYDYSSAKAQGFSCRCIKDR